MAPTDKNKAAPAQIHLIEGLAKKGTFNKLEAQDWSTLFEMGERRAYTHDEVILRQGKVADALYVVLEGEVNVELYNGESKIRLAHLGVGAMFGEMSFLDRAGASAHVVAHGEVKVLYIDGADILKFMAEDDAFKARFYHSLASTLSRRLRAANELLHMVR